MKISQQFIKLSIILFLCTAFIFSFSHFGAKAFDQFSSHPGTYAIGTVIGNIDVSGKTESEAENILQQSYVNWQQNAQIDFQYSEKVATFDKGLLKLDAETTMNSIKEGQRNPVYITIDQAQMEEQINILFPEIDGKEIDLLKLTNALEKSAANFTSGPSLYVLNKDYLAANAVNKELEINEVEIKLEESPFDLETVIEKTPEIFLAGGADFSLLEWAKEQNIKNQDTLNVLASGIYQAVLPTNFVIVDRSISNVLPNYSELGYEAMVSPSKNMDLVISNPNKSAYTFVFNFKNNVLKVSLKGQKLLYHYNISKKDEEQLKPKTIIQYSPLLQTGKTIVKEHGSDGKYVKVFREIYQDDQLLKNELISEDYYPAVYRIEILSIAGSTDGTSASIDTQSGTVGNQEETKTAGQPNTTQDTLQQGSNAEDLWGKSNEQPK